MGEAELTKLYIEVLVNDSVRGLQDKIHKMNKRLKELELFFGAVQKVSEKLTIKVYLLELSKRLIEGKKHDSNFSPLSLQLDNVAIAYSNKINELCNFYQSKGLSFVDSSLIPIILSYFGAILDKSEYFLDIVDKNIVRMYKQSYGKLVFTKKMREQLGTELATIESIVEFFRQAYNEISDFSIGKDFGQLIDGEKDFISELEVSLNPNGEYKDAVIHNCNVELALLGFSDYKGTKYPLISSETEFIYSNKVFAFTNKKKEEIKAKYEKTPYVLSSLLNQLNDYENCMADAFEGTSADIVKKIYAKLECFDDSREVVDALGKYIELYELEWDLESINNELVALGWQSKVAELAEKRKSGCYKYYTDYCHNRDSENAEKLYEQLIENKDGRSFQKKSSF